MKLFFVLAVVIFTVLRATCQIPIEVYASNIKISGGEEEILYFGFHEGDKIILNFEEKGGKEIKELEIIEYPNISKFMDFKSKAIVNKMIQVNHTGIFSFRFSNSLLGSKICSVKIERIPKDSSSVNFDTNVYWKTINDTTYRTVQETYIAKSDTTYSDFYSSTPQISSQNALNGNRPYQVINFSLPENTIAWSFYIGTGTEASREYERARSDFLKNASSVVKYIPGYGPMAALALTGVNYINKVQGADNVKYYFLSSPNDVQLFYANQPFMQYKSGDVVNEASQMKSPLKGPIYIALYNDNTIDPILVVLKATAVIVKNTYATRNKEIMSIVTRQEPYLKE